MLLFYFLLLILYFKYYFICSNTYTTLRCRAFLPKSWKRNTVSRMQIFTNISANNGHGSQGKAVSKGQKRKRKWWKERDTPNARHVRVTECTAVVRKYNNACRVQRRVVRSVSWPRATFIAAPERAPGYAVTPFALCSCTLVERNLCTLRAIMVSPRPARACMVRYTAGGGWLQGRIV